MRNIRTSAIALAAATAAVAVVLLGATPAQAATGYDLDGTNPVDTGCSASGSPIKDFPITRQSDGARVGTARVMYSSACGTNWVAVDNWVAGATAWKYISRANQFFEQGEEDTVTGWSFGMQAYAPGSTCIAVQGFLTLPGDSSHADSGNQLVC
jgi:hypothetical protein